MALTFASLKLYARDQSQDRIDAKAGRIQGRCVNRALQHLAGERDWSFHRIRHRVIFRPPYDLTGICNMSPYSRTLTLDSAIASTQGGGLAVYPSGATFYFSGDTEMMRVYSMAAGRSTLTMYSTDLYVASTAASAANGVLAWDRFSMPPNFKSLATPPVERDYYKNLSYIAPGEFVEFKQTYAPTTAGPVYYTLQYNDHTNRWELQFWPIPNEYRSLDFHIYVYPPELSADSDVALWPDLFADALYATISLMVVKELRDTKRYPTAESDYRRSVMLAKELDVANLIHGPAGPPAPRGSKIDRSHHFRDVP